MNPVLPPHPLKKSTKNKILFLLKNQNGCAINLFTKTFSSKFVIKILSYLIHLIKLTFSIEKRF
jgi:hypothetical protein